MQGAMCVLVSDAAGARRSVSGCASRMHAPAPGCTPWRRCGVHHAARRQRVSRACGRVPRPRKQHHARAHARAGTHHSGSAATAASADASASAKPSGVAASAPRRARGRLKLGSMPAATMHASHASRRRPSAASAAAVLLTYAARFGSTALALRYLQPARTVHAGSDTHAATCGSVRRGHAQLKCFDVARSLEHAVALNLHPLRFLRTRGAGRMQCRGTPTQKRARG